jgi:hypothetical protein
MCYCRGAFAGNPTHTHTRKTMMQYNLTDDSKTWCFADRYQESVGKFELNCAPAYEAWVPAALLLEESGKDSTSKRFRKFLQTEFGDIIWYLFKYTAYHLPIRNGVNRISKKAIVQSLNTSGNKVLTYSDAFTQKLVTDVIEDLLKATELEYWGPKSKNQLIPDSLSTMFIRLFNYYECQHKRRDHLFNMRPRTIPTADCIACGARFTHTGQIIEPPSIDVDCATWTPEDAVPGGFGWIPGTDWGGDSEAQQRMRRD